MPQKVLGASQLISEAGQYESYLRILYKLEDNISCHQEKVTFSYLNVSLWVQGSHIWFQFYNQKVPGHSRVHLRKLGSMVCA